MTRATQLALERIDSAGQLAQLRDLLARDRDAGAGGQPAQPSIDASRAAADAVERAAAERALELRAELEQMPAQPVLRAGALGDEVLAVIGTAGGSPSRARRDRRPGSARRRRAPPRGRSRARRSDPTCPAGARPGARRPSAAAPPAPPARRPRSAPARAGARRAGSPRSPTPARQSSPRAQRSRGQMPRPRRP